MGGKKEEEEEGRGSLDDSKPRFLSASKDKMNGASEGGRGAPRERWLGVGLTSYATCTGDNVRISNLETHAS